MHTKKAADKAIQQSKSKTEQKNEPVKEKLSREEFRTKVGEKKWENDVLVCWNQYQLGLGWRMDNKEGRKKSA